MKRYLILVTALAAIAAATTAAASAQGPRPGPHPGKGRGLGLPAAFQDFRDCMETQGVEPRGPGAGPPSAAERAERDAAFEACKSHLPAAVVQRHEARERFRACLEEHGVTPRRPGAGPPPASDRAARRAAVAACKDLLPAFKARRGR